MSLVLSLEETGTVLLTGDAVDNRAQWEGQQRLRVLFSREQAARSLEILHELADRTGALTILGHDAAEWRQLKRAPGLYA